MSKIDKLSILGVRSFDNIRSETIQFHTPLTLIVGYNGSGKTTIIECLKYATTGQLPPNSKGGAFIHDPKLCGEKEVLAQVKLSFKGTQGARLVVTRSLQLTVKKTTRSQKTLEGSLLMIKDGERTTISSRVAELDQIMPQYLGVSEAILDSVIFCHQDESLWPMSEPAALKKKFDEIFEALKYTKAIDNIKVVRKNQGVELTKHKMMEEQYKIEKDRGERAERKSLQLQKEIEDLRAESEKLNEDMRIAMDGAREKHEQAREFQTIIVDLNNKRQQAESRREAVEELKQNLEELDKSDEWLESTLAQYEETMEQYRLEEEGYRKQYRELKESLEQCRRQMGEKMAERGQHQADKERHERQLQEREELVKTSARRHEIRGFEGELDDELIHTFIERIGKLARDKSRELELVQQTAEEESREAQAVVTDLQGRRSARTQDKVTAKQSITANDRRIGILQDEANAIKVDEGAKAVLDSQQTSLRERLKSATDKLEAADYDKMIKAKNLELREHEEDTTRLNDQLIQSTRMAQDRAQLDLKKTELRDRQRSLETMIATYGSKLEAIIGGDMTPATVERDFQAALKQKNSFLQDARAKRDMAAQNLQQAEYKLSSAKESHKRKTAEMKSCEKAVLNSIISPEGQPLLSVEDYMPELTQLEEDRDLLKSDLENFTHLNKFWSGCLETAEKKNQCHLCDRAFKPEEKSKTVTKLRKKLADDAQQATQKDLKETEEVLKSAQAARSQYEVYLRLSTKEVPPLEKEIRAAEEQRATLLTQLDEHDNLVRVQDEAKLDVEALAKPVSTIGRYQTEIASYEDEVNRIASQQKSLGDYMSLDEIREKLSKINEEIRQVKSAIADITREKDQARTAINTLELELRDIAGRIMNAGHQMKEKTTLLERIDEFKENNNIHRESIRQADIDLESLAPRLANALAKLDDVRERGRAKEKAINDECLKLQDTVTQLRRADDHISLYMSSGGPTRLLNCQRDIDTLDRNISNLEAQLSDVTSKANALKEQVDNSEKTKRNISDNLRYRKNTRALDILEADIAELESRNANEDERRLSAEARRLDMRYQKLLADRGPILGAMRAKDDELRGILRDWETEYKDAARKYKESHIKVETTKAAIEDLARYGSALDSAIMRYHSLKMEEINRIAGELWQATYQGTDIDTILIRSDAEAATSGKRNYNYRVCMVKQSAEMDMRGRCSAGQRVLASIIIRLALAECFGVNCGLIALDEPTTNLDQDNIKSLAESLHGIIKTRMAQSNFQLIVITHDEEFLRSMRCADFCDEYYRVSRDEQQKSVIERQSILEVI